MPYGIYKNRNRGYSFGDLFSLPELSYDPRRRSPYSPRTAPPSALPAPNLRPAPPAGPIGGPLPPPTTLPYAPTARPVSEQRQVSPLGGQYTPRALSERIYGATDTPAPEREPVPQGALATARTARAKALEESYSALSPRTRGRAGVGDIAEREGFRRVLTGEGMRFVPSDEPVDEGVPTYGSYEEFARRRGGTGYEEARTSRGAIEFAPEGTIATGADLTVGDVPERVYKERLAKFKSDVAEGRKRLGAFRKAQKNRRMSKAEKEQLALAEKEQGVLDSQVRIAEIQNQPAETLAKPLTGKDVDAYIGVVMPDLIPEGVDPLEFDEEATANKLKVLFRGATAEEWEVFRKMSRENKIAFLDRELNR